MVDPATKRYQKEDENIWRIMVDHYGVRGTNFNVHDQTLKILINGKAGIGALVGGNAARGVIEESTHLAMKLKEEFPNEVDKYLLAQKELALNSPINKKKSKGYFTKTLSQFISRKKPPLEDMLDDFIESGMNLLSCKPLEERDISTILSVCQTYLLENIPKIDKKYSFEDFNELKKYAMLGLRVLQGKMEVANDIVALDFSFDETLKQFDDSIKSYQPMLKSLALTALWGRYSNNSQVSRLAITQLETLRGEVSRNSYDYVISLSR
jgi:hypothetical protein